MFKNISTRPFLKNSFKSFGVNEKAIKIKMKSISSIENITRAMKMVQF